MTDRKHTVIDEGGYCRADGYSKQPLQEGYIRKGGTIPTADGYSKQPLQEGYIRKGGTNPSVSQVQARPPAPPPMRPAGQGQTSNSKTSGNAKK